MNMRLYNKVFPDKYDWVSPYQKISAQGQFKTQTRYNAMKTREVKRIYLVDNQ